MKRRQFIKTIGLGTGALATAGFPLHAYADSPEINKITILHTNDQHSRIDPFPNDGNRNAGLGGAARRTALIKKIRSEEKNVLLFDAGDIFQGTPYFNFYGGELEIKLMSQMGYDAATMGNHDFDGGIDGFEKQMVHANFPFITSNYDFKDTILNGKTLEYKFYNVEGIKIGVFGLGIELAGLVPKELYTETRYLDPVLVANNTALKLKKELKCDYVICLSHLGHKYQNNKVSDLVVAAESSDIDLIIGGHTHTFLREAVIIENQSGNPVFVNQAGWAGIMLGRLDIFFERNKKSNCQTCENLFVT
jgi:5'-nucleotidase